MKKIIIIILFSILIGTLCYAYFNYSSSNDLPRSETQYPQVFTGSGNKTLIVHFNEGPLQFRIKGAYVEITDVKNNLELILYEGESYRKSFYRDARLMKIKSSREWKIECN